MSVYSQQTIITNYTSPQMSFRDLKFSYIKQKIKEYKSRHIIKSSLKKKALLLDLENRFIMVNDKLCLKQEPVSNNTSTVSNNTSVVNPDVKIKKRLTPTLVSAHITQNIPNNNTIHMSLGQKRYFKHLEDLEARVQDKNYGKTSNYNDFKNGKVIKKSKTKGDTGLELYARAVARMNKKTVIFVY